MAKKENVVNLKDKPCFRPGLIAWLSGVSVAWAVAWYFICGCDISHAPLSLILMGCGVMSFFHAVVMGAWHSHVGVIYKRDPIRIFVRVFGAVSMVLFPVAILATDIDMYDLVEHPYLCSAYYLVILPFMLIPLFIQTLICNGFSEFLPFMPSGRYLKSLRNGEDIHGRDGECAIWSLFLSMGDDGYGHSSETFMDEHIPDEHRITDDYYGKHGEFDSNDRIRAHMEDMQQMANEPGFDPEDHGYDWDEISDARNDGFI